LLGQAEGKILRIKRVFVCVCVRERERENERENIQKVIFNCVDKNANRVS